MKKTIYEKLTSIGATIDHHESDLYVKASKEVEDVINEYCNKKEFNSLVSTFKSQIDGTKWFEISFAYDPFWRLKE